MSTFTQSPWLIAGDGKFVYALNSDGVNAFCAHVMDARTNDEELRANARLIAAAPELYAIAEAIREAWKSYERYGADSILENQPLIQAAILEELFYMAHPILESVGGAS